MGISQLDLASGSQQKFATRGLDQATVLDIGSQQDDLTTSTRDNRSAIDDRTAFGSSEETQLAGEEIAVGDIERRGEKTIRVDTRAVADDDAVRVDQENTAIGLQLSKQL